MARGTGCRGGGALGVGWWRLMVPAAGSVVVVFAGGCAGPFDSPPGRADGLRSAVLSAVERDLGVEPGADLSRDLTREPADLDFGGERMAELERMAGPDAEGYEGVPELGPGLISGSVRVDGEGGRTSFGGEVVRLTLAEAVLSAVEKNLDVRVARFAPAIDENRVTEAEAAFDFVAFAGADYSDVDEPTQAPFFNPTAANVTESVGIDAGLRKLLTTGGTVEVVNEYRYSENDTPGFNVSPDPASSASVRASLSQPLLRGFGRDVNLAEVRLSENARRSSVQELRDALRVTVLEVERAYWELRFAERELKIRQRLLERGLEVRDVLRERLDAEFDVRPAEFSDAVATVERRRGDIISAQNRLMRASDRLKLLMADERYPVAGEEVLLAAEDVVDEPVRISLLDALRDAVGRRPEVLRAALSIDASDINLAVAENQLLPDLDLVLEADYQGLDPEADEAYREVFQGRFISTLIGLEFERALGNRREESAFARRRLERLRAATDYQRVARRVVDEVKEALRGLDTAYRLIVQSRVSRLAAAENLRTLLVEKELTRALTADFLDLEFSRQEQLAVAEVNEARALADYAIAQASLDASTATNLERHGIVFVVPESDELLDEPRPLFPLIDEPGGSAGSGDEGSVSG